MSTITIGLLWHSVNSDNLGVGALTASNIAIIEDLAKSFNVQPKFLVIGWQDPEPAYISGENIEVVAIRTRHLVWYSKFHSAVRKCDFIIDISAGDSFADIYGMKRIRMNFLSKLGVVLTGTPLLFGPQTIGPFKATWTRIVSNFLMKRAALVTTRDKLSSDYVAPLGLGDKAIEATDVAMRLPYDRSTYPRNSNVRVGLNISGLLYNGGYTGQNMFDLKSDYAKVVQRIVQTLLQDESRPEIHLIGHVNSRTMPVEDDYRVCEALSKQFPGTVLAPRFKNPSDAKSYISSMDFFAGARMHACIAAFSSGVPVVPMAYSRKFEGLFGTLDFNRTTDCRKEDEESIVQAVVGGYRDRETIGMEVRESLKRANKKLSIYEDHLVKYFSPKSTETKDAN